MVGNGNSYQESPCLICWQRSPRLLTKKGQFGFPTFVSICRNCGLVYLNPRWSKEKYMDFYRNEYDNLYRMEVYSEEPREWRFENIKRIYARIANTITIDETKSVLDIGSGMGESLIFLQNKIGNIRLYAIEASKNCINHLKKRTNVQLITDDIDSKWQLEFRDQIDLVLMRHVLEHLLDPLEALHKLSHIVNSNGHIYISVPNMMKPTGSLNNYYFRVVHTFYFSEQTLLNCCRLAGLYPIKIDSSGAEIWGIFKVNESTLPTIDLRHSVYKKQLHAIFRHLLMDALRNRKALLRACCRKSLSFLTSNGS